MGLMSDGMAVAMYTTLSGLIGRGAAADAILSALMNRPRKCFSLATD